MASDADVVRCASLWPGMAAQLLEGLAQLGADAWNTERLYSTAGANVVLGDAPRNKFFRCSCRSIPAFTRLAVRIVLYSLALPEPPFAVSTIW